MTNEIVNTQTGEITAKKSGFSAEQVELIKKTVCRGATDDELALFLHICQRAGLDPFAKQIYAIKRNVQGKEVMTYQTSIDGYRAIAERTGCYAPGKEATYAYDTDGSVLSATAYINKKVDGKWFEVSATAHFSEYCPKWWDSKKGEWKTPDMWVKMPHAMLAKCAESAVLRRAFPNEMSGTYTQEEMSQADTQQERHVAMPKRTDEVPVATEIIE